MTPSLVCKARDNRNAALSYLRVQKRTLVQLTDFRLKGRVRRPFPVVGFSSSRARIAPGEAA